VSQPLSLHFWVVKGFVALSEWNGLSCKSCTVYLCFRLPLLVLHVLIRTKCVEILTPVTFTFFLNCRRVCLYIFIVFCINSESIVTMFFLIPPVISTLNFDIGIIYVRLEVTGL